MDTWITTDKYIVAYSNKILETKYKKIHMFDLDGTIIKTKSGKTFPVDNNDWIFFDQNVINTINNLECVGIITNQSGLKNKEKIDGWKEKIKNITKEINILFLFCSLTTNIYRKPMDGSWKYLIKNVFLKTDVNKLLKKEKIYYIGDACGRKNDFSDTDYKFALNCKFKFKTPETFFKIDVVNANDQIKTITYPQINENYYELNEYNTFMQDMFDKIDSLINQENNIYIMTIGLPASGKSFIRELLLEKYNNYFYYFNNDDIKNKNENAFLIKNIKTAIKNNVKNIIDDNTNINYEKRNETIKLITNYKKVCILFSHDVNTCMHLNLMRMYYLETEPISKIAYNTLNKKFKSNENNKINNIKKEFDLFFCVDKLFPQYKNYNKLEYFF